MLTIFLTALFAYLASASHAEAGPAFFAVLSAGGGFGAAFAATSVGSFLTTTFTGRLLASVAISALQSALAPKPKQPGITTSATSTGGVNPCGFILGWSATAGDAVCPMMSHGKVGKTPNAYLTYVIALGDIPGQVLGRVAVDGAFVNFDPSADHADYGAGLGGKYRGYAWVKYYDGSQTAADPGLLKHYSSYPERPWQADMIGTGVPYAICTFRYNRDLYKGLPEMLFECGGIKVYDPRRDSTAGGAGAHRWGNSASYEASANNAVLAYNIHRGITLPGLGLWGGRAEAEDLPVANWFAAMNACDQSLPGVWLGTAQFRAGIEVKVDSEPAAIVEELLKACNGQIAEVGGAFKIRVGGPGLPVMFIGDDDLIVTKPQDYAPFAQSDQRQNGIDAKYPDPEAVWQTKSAPSLYNPAWEAEDADRRVASLDLPACPFPLQVQRVMAAYIKDERRFRTHGVTLPPDAAVLEPLDVISWTSARNGYDGKLFELSEVVDDPKTLLQRVALRECDPSDYDWSAVTPLPTFVPSAVEVVPGPQTLSSWVVTAIVIEDASATKRRPAIRMSWDASDLDAVSAIQFELRIKNGDTVQSGDTVDVGAGSIICAEGILPNVAYQSRGKPVALGRATAWTDWVEVISGDVRLGSADLADPVNQAIDDALTLAADAQARIDAEAARITAEAQIAAAALSAETAARVAALNAEAGAIRAEMLAEAEAAFPRDVSIDTALNDLGARVTNLLIGLSETQSRLAGAGIFVDPESGTIQIEAVSRLDGELGEARIELDAVRGEITLLATKTYVDGVISNAILDPSQIPIIGSIEARLNSAELALSGAEAAIAAKASSLEVDAQGARLTAAELEIDGLQGEISLKASTTDLTAAEARITEAEAELSTIDGAAFSIGLRDIRVLGEAQDDQALLTLSDLLRSYEDHETRRADIAFATQDMLALVNEDREATASLKTALGARIDDTVALVASEATARASADEAEASERTALAARVTSAELGLTGTSEVVSALTTRTDAVEGAITSQASQLTSLSSSLAATNAAVGAAQEDADAAQALAATKADASALTALETRTTEVEGVVTSQASQITALSSTVTTNAADAAAATAAALAAANAANTLAGGKGRVFFQTAAPSGADRTAQNLWIDTTGGANTPKRWSGSAWVAVTDKVATDAVAAAAAAQLTANTVAADLTNNYYTKTTVDEALAAQSTALSSTITANAGTAAAASAAAATAAAAAQSKADTVEARLVNDYMTASTTTSAIAAAKTELNSTIFANAGTAAAASAAALAAANAANTLAGGKGRVFFQTTAPSGADQSAQNLWIDTTGGANTPKRWSGSAWIAVTDKVATDAVAAAAAAATAAAAAQLTANTVSANLASNYYTKTTVDTALAAQNLALSASIGTVNATVEQNAAALVKLDGFAAASYTLRLGAGGSAAGLEIVSASDPIEGETSVFKIAAKHFEVTAASMRITGGVGAALNLDPNLQDASAWGGASTPNIVSIPDGASGNKAIRSVAGADQTIASLAFAVNPAKTLRLRGSFRKSAGADGQSYFRLYWYSGSGVEIGFTSATVPAASTAFQEVQATGIVPPLNARFARIAVLPGFGGTLGYHEWQGISCEEQIDTTLVVDGAIRARHLATDTLITQSAQIGNGIILNANLGDAQITAAKILDLQVTNAKLASAAVTTAKIGDLQVDTLKIAGNAVTVFRGARNTALANSTVNAWTTVAWVGFTPTDGANSLLAMVGAGMTLTSGASGGGVTARGNARLLWRGNVVREFIDVMTLVAGGNTLKSPLAMTEILTAGWGYGELVFQISKGETAGNFTVDASLIAGEFKR
jgi:hypothetical protein